MNVSKRTRKIASLQFVSGLWGQHLCCPPTSRLTTPSVIHSYQQDMPLHELTLFDLSLNLIIVNDDVHIKEPVIEQQEQ